MKADNRKFVSQETFSQRVKEVMRYKRINIDSLYEIISNKIGYEITKNNLSVYLQRVPNVNFLIALSKALNISTDYLLGLDTGELLSEGIDYDFESDRYKKYEGEFFFYFFPTVNSSPMKIISAKLEIEHTIDYNVTLTINTKDSGIKSYVGKLVLSNTYSIGYISLKSKNFGEMVYLSFCDPEFNNKDRSVEVFLAAMLSISSGGLKRVPVMSRCLISREEILNKYEDIVKSNLYLNTKYINITPDSIEKTINDMFDDKKLRIDIEKKLKDAFSEKTYYPIEESYILNTLKNDLELDDAQAVELLTNMRLFSIKSANSKIDDSLDTRIYTCMSALKNE